MATSSVATPYLRDRNKYRDAAWDWSILGGCFGGRIRPSDIDGIVERNGRFLVLEAKPRGYTFNGGQAILFKRLAQQPNFTVLVLYGEVSQPTAMQVWGEKQQPCNLGDVRAFCQGWFEWADSQGALL